MYGRSGNFHLNLAISFNSMEWKVTHGYTSATVVKEQFFKLENIIFASPGNQELFLLLKIS